MKLTPVFCKRVDKTTYQMTKFEVKDIQFITYGGVIIQEKGFYEENQIASIVSLENNLVYEKLDTITLRLASHYDTDLALSQEVIAYVLCF
jgi:hypothetical protein